MRSRYAMMLEALANPIPGSVSNISAVAVFRSMGKTLLLSDVTWQTADTPEGRVSDGEEERTYPQDSAIKSPHSRPRNRCRNDISPFSFSFVFFCILSHFSTEVNSFNVKMNFHEFFLAKRREMGYNTKYSRRD